MPVDLPAGQLLDKIDRAAGAARSLFRDLAPIMPGTILRPRHEI
jgi:hypothetical protein